MPLLRVRHHQQRRVHPLPRMPHQMELDLPVTKPTRSRGYYRVRTAVRIIASLCAGSIVLLGGFVVGAAISQTQSALTHFIQTQLNQKTFKSPQEQLLEIMTDPYAYDHYSRVGDHSLPLHFAYSPMTKMFAVSLDNANHPASHLVSAGIICGNESREITVDSAGIAIFETTPWPCEGLIATIDDGTDRYYARVSLADDKVERNVADLPPKEAGS